MGSQNGDSSAHVQCVAAATQDEATLGYTETLGHPLLLQAIWQRYRSKVEEHQRRGKLPLEVKEQTAVSITACVLGSAIMDSWLATASHGLRMSI